MQNRIEESINFEAQIQDDPFVLLTAIKLKMYGQTRARYEYVQPTDILLQFLSLKQEHAESLVDYTRRFKQGKDNLEAIMGAQFLDGFIEKTEKYKICLLYTSPSPRD